MIGDTSSGAFRLVLFLVAWIGSTFAGLAHSRELSVICALLFLGVFIAWISDLFIISKLTREKNLEKISSIID